MAQLSGDLYDYSRDIASSLKVNPEIHDQDLIFDFLFNNPSFVTKKDAVRYYFEDGRGSARKLKALLDELLGPDKQGLSLLEFASGYGCVTRHFGNELPHVQVTSCDIHSRATTFIQDVLGTRAVLSRAVPEDLDLGEKFDAVFALSFFSHMPDRTWGRWIRTLYSHLNDGGLLIFTTQGKESAKFFKQAALDETGYWFSSESEQKDLSTSDYGQTIVTPEYVVRKCFQHIAAPMAILKSAFWWEHQDLYVFARDWKHRSAV